MTLPEKWQKPGSHGQCTPEDSQHVHKIIHGICSGASYTSNHHFKQSRPCPFFSFQPCSQRQSFAVAFLSPHAQLRIWSGQASFHPRCVLASKCSGVKELFYPGNRLFFQGKKLGKKHDQATATWPGWLEVRISTSGNPSLRINGLRSTSDTWLHSRSGDLARAWLQVIENYC